MDDAELIEQTMIYDATEWPQQAHMMSVPTEPAPDPLLAHVEMIAALTVERDALRAETSELRAKVERLQHDWESRVDRMHAVLAPCQGIHARKHLIDALCDEIERLRKGRDDADTSSRVAGAEVVLASGRQAVTAEALLAVNPSALDHRLGTPQPDGEPVEPMSSRKAYRWGMV